MKFTFNVNMAVQFLGMAVQGLTMATHAIPDGEAKVILVLTIAVLQSASALAAHFTNPDGGSASEPYVKK